MELVNAMYQFGTTHKSCEILLILLSPFVPFMTEEIGSLWGNTYSIHQQSWPSYDEAKLQQDDITMVFMINGKLKHKEIIQKDVSKEFLVNFVNQHEKLSKFILGKKIENIIFIPNKLLNIVIS
jgi:leucyl-tRNA synthetase